MCKKQKKLFKFSFKIGCLIKQMINQFGGCLSSEEIEKLDLAGGLINEVKDSISKCRYL